MTLRDVLAGTALVVTATLLSPTAAHAERWASSDDAADVAGWLVDPAPEPCGTSTPVDASANANDDVTRLVVSHQRRVVKVVVRFRDLDPGLGQRVSVHLTSGRRAWLLEVHRFRDFDTDVFQTSTFLAREPLPPAETDDSDEGCGPVAIVPTGCHVRPRLDLAANALRVEVPRSCLHRPRWLRAGVRTSGSADAPDAPEGSFLAFTDDWGTGAGEGWWPLYGPAVRAPRGAPVGRG